MSSDRSIASEGTPVGTVEERLTALERASDERRRELRELATQLPAAVSRRALLEGAARDLRSAPNKADIAKRGARKILRTPIAAARRLASRR